MGQDELPERDMTEDEEYTVDAMLLSAIGGMRDFAGLQASHILGAMVVYEYLGEDGDRYQGSYYTEGTTHWSRVGMLTTELQDLQAIQTTERIRQAMKEIEEED